MHIYDGKSIIMNDGGHPIVYRSVCFSYVEEKHPHGIFLKAYNLESVLHVFMLQIILAFFSSWTIYFILRPLRQPKFVCNMLAGILLGPSLLGRNQAFMETFFPPREMLLFNTMVKLGTAYLIFLVAVKMDTDILLKSAKRTWPIGLCCYILPLTVTVIFTIAVRKELSSCIKDTRTITFLSGLLSISYFPVVAQFIDELNILTTEFGQLALTSSMFIQMLSFSLTFIAVFFSRDTYAHSIQYLFSVSVTILVVVYVIRPAMLLIIRTTPQGKPVERIYVVAILVGTLVISVITDLSWFDFNSGAFLMGLIVPHGPPLGATLVEKSELMIMEFFLPLFFVQVGYLSDVYSLKNLRATMMVLLVVSACYMTKIIGTLIASLYLNIRFLNAIVLALLLNFKGVVDFAGYHRFRAANQLDTQCYTAILLFNLLIVAVCYPLIEVFCKHQVKLAGHGSKTNRFTTLQSSSQSAELRTLTCIYHEDNVPGIIALLQTLSHRPLCAYVVHLIDLIGQTAPLLIPYKMQKRGSRSSSSSHIMHAFLNYSETEEGYVSIQPFTMVAPFRTMHNIICNLAEEKRNPFIIVPFHENQLLGVNSKQKGVLRDFNCQLQVNSPCTVGILFDRGLQLPVNHGNASFYQIAVFFVGGADDREALALAIRMSGNPDVNITVLRINSEKDQAINFSESHLDDLLVQEFVEKNIHNPGVFFQELKVNDSVQMLDVIESLTKTYDLIILGKNSGARQFEKEVLDWVEFPELGVIGDLLASTDFCGDETSLLVMEHGM